MDEWGTDEDSSVPNSQLISLSVSKVYCHCRRALKSIANSAQVIIGTLWDWTEQADRRSSLGRTRDAALPANSCRIGRSHQDLDVCDRRSFVLSWWYWSLLRAQLMILIGKFKNCAIWADRLLKCCWYGIIVARERNLAALLITRSSLDINLLQW